MSYVGGLLAPHDEALRGGARRRARRPGCRRSRSRRRRGSCCSCWRRLMGARTVLEFGTLGGYSTIWLGAGAACGRAADHAGGQSRVRRGGAREHRAGRAGRGRRPAGRAGAGDAAAAGARGRRPVRPHLHRRRQGQHAQLLRLGARPLAPRQPDRRRQRRPRRQRWPTPDSDDPTIQAQRRFHEMLAAEPRVTATTIQTRRRQGLRRLHARPGHQPSTDPRATPGDLAPAIFPGRPKGRCCACRPTPGAGGNPVFDTKPER